MDRSITLVTPALMRERGARDFDRDIPIDGHNMNPGAPTIIHWTQGWRQQQLKRQAEARTELVRQVARAQFAEVSPP